jgi:hypothetical protein
MPDATVRVSDPPASGATARAATGGAGDPLASLYKMSTTAGLGSGEYVAINGTAIAAVTLGAASALTLLGELFLVIPLVAIVCAVLAIQQVRDSNGTQKGIGLAVCGIALALAFGGYVLAQRVGGYMAQRDDRAAIAAKVVDWGEAVKAGSADALYDQFSDGFRQRVDRERFNNVLRSMKSNPLYGDLLRVESNNVVVFEDDPTSGRQVAMTTAKLRFSKMTGNEAYRATVQFRKLPGEANWQFDNVADLFPADPPASGPGQSGPASVRSPIGG